MSSPENREKLKLPPDKSTTFKSKNGQAVVSYKGNSTLPFSALEQSWADSPSALSSAKSKDTPRYSSQ